MKEKIYVTYTCRNPKCGKAFMDVDPYNKINDEPLKTKFCPECVAKGFKVGRKKVRSKDREYAQYFKEQIKENNIVDKQAITFLKREYNKMIKNKTLLGARIDKRFIFKDACELLSYQNWS